LELFTSAACKLIGLNINNRINAIGSGLIKDASCYENEKNDGSSKILYILFLFINFSKMHITTIENLIKIATSRLPTVTRLYVYCLCTLGSL